MTIGMVKLLALGLLALVAGCAPVHWYRPGMSDAEFLHDAAECNALAREQVFRQSPYPLLHRPYWPHRSQELGFGRDPLAWRLQREGELYDFCLRSRGYRLIPAG